jgi:ligand-binding sensor domain-containing protein
MSIRLNKPLQELNLENIAAVQGQLGVYQLADVNGAVFYIGYAGGRSLFGLHGELKREMTDHEGQTVFFRHEVTMQYMSRYEELLMLHKFDFGELPERVLNEYPHKIGNLSPLS